MSTPTKEIITNHIQHSIVAKQAMLAQLVPDIDRVAGIIIAAYKKKHCLYVMGNGGSASDALHFAEELTGRYQRNDRPPLPAHVLVASSPLLTAIGNDFGFDQVFSRQVEACVRAGDILVALSTSGNSPNILKAVAEGKKKKAITIGFCGGTGGQLAAMADYALIVPSSSTAHIQECHITIAHAICVIIDQSFAPVP